MVPTYKTVLAVEGLEAGYGQRRVLRGINIHVGKREIVALIGHNGAGKTTFFKTVFGLVPRWAGEIVICGTVLPVVSPRRLLSLGVAYLPQGNRVFGELTVRENLQVGGRLLRDSSRVSERIATLCGRFPSIRPELSRRAGTLSGGERQLLALASSLMLSPRLLLLDEPSAGLAPLLAGEVFRHLDHLRRDADVSLVIAEQKVRAVLEIADRVYVLRSGSVSFEGPAHELTQEADLTRVYL